MVVDGLAKLNGRTGKAVSFDSEMRRYLVELDVAFDDGDCEMYVRPRHLKLFNRRNIQRTVLLYILCV